MTMFRIVSDLTGMNDLPENCAVCWTQGKSVIKMAFDRLGRRVWMRESEDDTVTKENASSTTAPSVSSVWMPRRAAPVAPLSSPRFFPNGTSAKTMGGRERSAGV